MVSSPDPVPVSNPPPPPVPTANNAAEGADRLEEDIRKQRRSTSGSFLGGESSPAPARTAGTSFLG